MQSTRPKFMAGLVALMVPLICLSQVSPTTAAESSAQTRVPWDIRPTSATTQCTGEEFIVAWVRPRRGLDGRPKRVDIDFYLRNAQPGERWTFGTTVSYEVGNEGVVQSGDGVFTVPASGGGYITGAAVPAHARTVADIIASKQSELPLDPSTSECQIGVRFRY